MAASIFPLESLEPSKKKRVEEEEEERREEKKGHQRAVLGRFLVVLGGLGGSWAALGRLLGGLGRSGSRLGSVLGRLGSSWVV